MQTVERMAGLFVQQREWRSWLIYAFFLGGLGAGLYIVSLILNYTLGMILGLLIVGVGKNGCHLLFLGKRLRFWRLFSRPGTSWISRGGICIVLFCILGFLYILPGISGVEWGGSFTTFLAITSVASALGVMLYTGFVMATAISIPAWNSAVLPLAYSIYAFMGGLDIVLILDGILEAKLPVGVHNIEAVQIVVMSLGLLIVISYLVQLNRSNDAGRQTVKLLFNEYAPMFVGGVLLLGIVALILVIVSFLQGSTPLIMILSGVCALIASFLLRVSLFKVGVYNPLLS